MVDTQKKEGEMTTFLCGKAESFLSKIPDARDVIANSERVDAGVTQLLSGLSRAALGVQETCWSSADP